MVGDGHKSVSLPKDRSLTTLPYMEKNAYQLEVVFIEAPLFTQRVFQVPT